jgi:hypothetical protein
MMIVKRFSICAMALLLAAAGVRAAGPDAVLADAAERMDRAAIRTLLQQHVDVNTPQVDGMTALHWAAFKDDLDTSQLLLRAGASVKAANRYGVTPLSLACVNGNGEMVELFLKAGADPNTALPGGETALMTAARTGSLAPVKSLLIRGAKVDSTDERHGQTQLEIRTGFDQLCHDLGVAFGRRPHQRRLPAPRVAAVDVGAANDQRLDRRKAAGSRRRHQRGFASRERGVRIRPAFEEQLDHLAVAVDARQRERRHPVSVRGLDVGAGAHQELAGFQIVLEGRPVQRRHPVDLRRVDIGALLQERANCRAIHPFRRVGQHRVGTGATHDRRREHENQPADAEAFHSSPSIVPVLSANASRWTPAFSSSVRCRLANGVGSAYLM